MITTEIKLILDTHFSHLPPYVISAGILLGSFTLAKIINWLFHLLYINLLKRTPSHLDDKVLKHLKTSLHWSVVLAGLHFSLVPFDFYIQISSIYDKIILSVLTLLWGWTGAEIIADFFEEAIENKQGRQLAKRKGLLPFLENVFRVTAGIIALLFIFEIWSINIAPILASAGFIGIAIGFAAKDTVANFFGGISVFFDQPYKIGDYVVINDNYRGQVTDIGMRSTKIKTRDNVQLTIPNSVMVTGAVVNETGHDGTLRIRIPLGVSYDADLDHVEEIIREIMSSHEAVLDDSSAKVLFRSFGPSTIKVEALGVLTDPAQRGRITHELIKKIHQRFAEENIEMPAPQREVYLHQQE